MNFEELKGAPRDFCAAIILPISVNNVGTNRNAIENVIAISFGEPPNILTGFTKYSNALTKEAGEVVKVSNAVPETRQEILKNINKTEIRPSFVIFRNHTLKITSPEIRKTFMMAVIAIIGMIIFKFFHNALRGIFAIL
ncbi:hypothetical protein FACS189481_3020 [Clostridia bacterium]|nr:hypothetical protein FACS189481_3020 [Clostridia bacterium]